MTTHDQRRARAARTADIMRRRRDGETLREIAAALGISAQRVHQVQTRALNAELAREARAARDAR